MNILEYCYYNKYYNIMNNIYKEIKEQYKNEDFLEYCKNNDFNGVYINIRN